MALALICGSARSVLLRNPKVALLLALVMSGSIWFYVQRVLIPYQEADAAAHGRPRGILSDLYPRWVGTRELLLNHRDPYSPEVTREIQRGYYGRVLDPNRPEDPKDEQRFAYPVYVVFFLAPTVTSPFPAVRLGFRWALEILTAMSVLLWLRVLRWRPSRTTLAILLMLALSSWAAVQGVKLQQLSLLVGSLIAASAALLTGGQLFLAGVFLALASVKPQLLVLPVAWLMLWVLGDWRERQPLFWGFTVSLAVLVGGGEYLLPGWVGRFAAAVVAYEHYTGGGSLLDVLATRTGGTVLTILSLLGTAAVGWRLRRVPADSPAFSLVTALSLAVTVVVVPMMAPYNHVLLLPAVLLIARSWDYLWQRNVLTRVICTCAVVIVFWQWLASFGLVVASLVLPAASVQKAWAVPLWTSIGVPLIILPLLASLVLGTLPQGKRLARSADDMDVAPA
jgi:hypothetical protein